MRELADAQRIRSFMRQLGRESDVEAACYLTGGTTAVLVGWRPTTIDVDKPERAHSLFAEIEPELYRFPAVDAPAFRARVEEAFRP